jgi:histidine ammonia-lyase
MTTVLNSRFDLTLDAVMSVAWRGDDVRLGSQARDMIAVRRQAFLDYIANDPDASVYGVNQGQGEMIGLAMNIEERQRLARMKPLAAAVPFGEPYPARVVRTMMLARFANLMEGHGMGTPRLAEEIAGLLNARAHPVVGQQGQGGPGEILALYTLFADLSKKLDLEPGERGALINGSPGASALLADATLVAERRLLVAQKVLALAIVAFNAPMEHYETVVGNLLGGSHNRDAFTGLAKLLDGMADLAPPRGYQAPVSYRIVPYVLGQAEHAVVTARDLAGEAMASVTHNPIYMMPDDDHPHGHCLSTGGYHNALAAPAMDAVSGAWADLCLMCQRLCVGLLNGRASGYPDFLLSGRRVGEVDGHGAVGYLPMAIVGFMEEARSVASRTFIPAADASVFGQDDVTAPAFLAWPKTMKSGACLDACLAILAVASSQALFVTGRERVPDGLEALLANIRRIVPPVTDDRVLGPELGQLADHLTAEVLAEDCVEENTA